jgi:SNW domain-containing protein 1
LFGAASSQRLYRPTEVDTDTYGGGGGDDDVRSLLEKSSGKFRPDKGFSGTAEKEAAESRTGPVQFEKEEADPFGLEKFLTAAKEGKSLDKIGSKGFMSAAAGGGGSSTEYHSSSKRKMEFVESSSSSSRRHRSPSSSRSRSRSRDRHHRRR